MHLLRESLAWASSEDEVGREGEEMKSEGESEARQGEKSMAHCRQVGAVVVMNIYRAAV